MDEAEDEELNEAAADVRARFEGLWFCRRPAAVALFRVSGGAAASRFRGRRVGILDIRGSISGRWLVWMGECASDKREE